jgi:hypothetical protein
VVKLAYLVFPSDGHPVGGMATVPDSILASMARRCTYIAHGEALAPLLALWHEHDLVDHSSLRWFIDNLGVLAALCKGSSVVADFGCVIHSVLLAVAQLHSHVWWEHVDSQANLADGGTRESFALAAKLGVTYHPRSLPPWPQNTLDAEPDAWLPFLHDANVKMAVQWRLVLWWVLVLPVMAVQWMLMGAT